MLVGTWCSGTFWGETSPKLWESPKSTKQHQESSECSDHTCCSQSGV